MIGLAVALATLLIAVDTATRLSSKATDRQISPTENRIESNQSNQIKSNQSINRRHRHRRRRRRHKRDDFRDELLLCVGNQDSRTA
jgi:hypothetical protein